MEPLNLLSDPQNKEQIAHRLSALMFQQMFSPQVVGMEMGKAKGCLWLLDGQYVFQSPDRQGRGTHFKWLSPGSVKSAFNDQAISSGWLGENIKLWGTGSQGSYMVKWLPPGRHDLHVIVVEAQTEAAASEAATGNAPTSTSRTLSAKPGIEKALFLKGVALPGLVFMGYGARYYIWAVQDTSFNPKMEAFHAPLPNVDSKGLICFGSNPLPEVGAETFERSWELFFSSPFNAHMVQGKSLEFPDIRAKLIEMSVVSSAIEKDSLLAPAPAAATATLVEEVPGITSYNVLDLVSQGSSIERLVHKIIED